MSIMDIINPWGAVRRLRKELEDAYAAYWVEREKWTARNSKLEKLIANGHFRNPKTGRLGRKGVTYK